MRTQSGDEWSHITTTWSTRLSSFRVPASLRWWEIQISRAAECIWIVWITSRKGLPTRSRTNHYRAEIFRRSNQSYFITSSRSPRFIWKQKLTTRRLTWISISPPQGHVGGRKEVWRGPHNREISSPAHRGNSSSEVCHRLCLYRRFHPTENSSFQHDDDSSTDLAITGTLTPALIEAS